MPKYNTSYYKKYIANHQIEPLLEQLLQHLHQYLSFHPNSHLQNTYDALIMQSGKWKSIQQEESLNIVEPQAAKREKARISQAVLGIINGLPAYYFDFLNGDKKQQKAASPDLRQQVEKVHKSSAFEYDVFFSFSSQDLHEAKRICEELRGYGLHVFLSDEALKVNTGTSFFEKIEQALKNSQHFILLSSVSSMTAEWVKIEYETFFNEYYIKNKKERRFFILKSKNFSVALVPGLLKRLQFANTPKEILATFIRDKRFQDKQAEKKRQATWIAFFDKNGKKIGIGILVLFLLVLGNQVLPKMFTKTKADIIQEIKDNMKTIPAGTFTMGCTSEQSDCDKNEKPTHKVSISSFKINKYEVTQEEWRAVMSSNSPELKFKGCDKCPVKKVSWNDIQDFLKKLNQLTGKSYRLPSEAEWEYAARGNENYKYAGTNYIRTVASYRENSGSKTHPVGRKKANGFGLYDMSGNVWEWCQDNWHENYNDAPNEGHVWTGGDSSLRVNRGGSWGSLAQCCRIAYRRGSPDARINDIGFRLAHR